MTGAERLAEVIGRLIPRVHAGTLCVFGDWFGRPHDNRHSVVGAEADGDTLTLTFEEGETLTVVRPRNATVTDDEFRIERADRVRWEWFYYGEPHRPENRYFIEHRVIGEEVTALSNVDWYEPVFHPSLEQPAVELD